MPHPDYRTCKTCGRDRNEVGPLSWTRQCRSCGMATLEANMDQIAAKSGPYFERQQRRTLMAAQRALLAAERKTG